MFLVISFIFGTIIGSFLNVVIWRLPREEGLGGRSNCPHCRHTLSWWELAPLLSYIFLKGRCVNCRKPISPRYLIIEGVTGLLFALAWYLVQPNLALEYLLLLKSLLIISVFVVVFVVDLEHYLILDSVIFPASVTVALMNIAADLLGKHSLFVWPNYFLGGLVGAILACLPFFLLWYFSKGEWMGFGDVKLALFLGLALGWPNVLANLFAAVLLGGVVSVILLLSRAKTMKSRIPFGTFLSLGGIIALFYGEKLLSWYLALLGF